jgi:hypothetical protein
LQGIYQNTFLKSNIPITSATSKSISHLRPSIGTAKGLCIHVFKHFHMNKSSLFAAFPPFFLLHSKTPPTDDRKEEWNNKIFSLDLKISVSLESGNP